MILPNQWVPTGQFSYPFSLQTPEDLPGSMALAPKISQEYPSMSIRYVLLAQYVPCASNLWADQAKGVSVFRTQQPVYAFKPLPQE